MAADGANCSQCGVEIPAGAPKGLCSRCLIKMDKPNDTKIEINGQSDTKSNISTKLNFFNHFGPPDPRELSGQFTDLEIISLIGSGSMGAVYQARQKWPLDRLVALKILLPEVAQDPTFAGRFEREAHSIAKLDHPNIIKIHTFGETRNGLFYFIMEFVRRDLRKVTKAAKLKPSEVYPIILQICNALQYAHQEGIVHRDIKPENILLRKDYRVKIADFGLAKLLGHSSAIPKLTETGRRMGTPDYMAPEQIINTHDVDQRADLYSLGVVFYEMLTHRLPPAEFQAPSEATSIDPRIDHVVQKMLERTVSARYQSADEVRDELEAILRGKTVIEKIDDHITRKPQHDSIDDRPRRLDSSGKLTQSVRKPSLSLHKSIQAGSIALVKAHIEYGSNLNVRKFFKLSPIETAARNNELEIVKLLYDNGAIVKDKDVFIQSILLGLPMLGRTTSLNSVTPAFLPEQIIEDYQAIRANLKLLGNNNIPRKLVITSPGMSEGKTTFSVNLATSMAESGLEVLLIDGDLRKPDIARLLNLPEGTRGLQDVLCGGKFKESVYYVKKTGLNVLAADFSVATDIYEMLTQPSTARIINAISKHYDHVIIDTPPVLGFPDTLIWSKISDHVIIVTYHGTTNNRDLKVTVKRLKEACANVLGIVISCVSKNWLYWNEPSSRQLKGYYTQIRDNDKVSRRKLMFSMEGSKAKSMVRDGLSPQNRN